MGGAQVQSGSISVATLGTNEVMLSGNLVAILSSGIIHFIYSKFIDPQDFDFSTLDAKIRLVENDTSGLTIEDQDPEMLDAAYKWITVRGWVLTIVLVVIWPLLSVPAGKFSKDYFTFWVLLAIAWGFGSAITITLLPVMESSEEISNVFRGLTGMGSKPAKAGESDDDAGFEEGA